MPELDGTPRLLVGTIGRAHGLRGQVTVRPRTDSVDLRFAPGAVLSAAGRTLTVASHSLSSGILVVGFSEVGDRGAAEALRGVDLWADGLPDNLEADEFHDSTLVGLAVLAPDGLRLGEVVGILHRPAQDLLVVRTAGGDRLVPFVTELVPIVDVGAGHVVINPIPGLLEEADNED